MNKRIADVCESDAREGVNTVSNLKEVLNCCLYGQSVEKDEFDVKFWTKKSSFVKEKAWDLLHYEETSTDEVEQLYWDSLKFETPYLFESYLIYTERKRPYKKRFYEPRKCTLKKVVDELQELEDSGKKVFQGISLPSRTGKALADGTPVLTIEGWKKHGDLVIGDKVLNSKGEFVEVYHVFPKCQSTHIVRFTDGEEIECHENHEWIVYDRHKTQTVVLETKEMIGCELDSYRGHERCRFQINHRDPVLGEYKSLPVAPYTLGAWLGDGTNIAPNITIDKNDVDICRRIEKDGYRVRHLYVHKDYGTHRYTFDDLRSALQEIGMCHSNRTTIKHIPGEYLTASIEQRLELLAGLLDTDGTLTRKEKRYHYSTTEKQLCDDFVSLVNTFGWRHSVSVQEPKVSTSGIVGRKKVYTIGFNPTMEIPCVLKRKQLSVFSKRKRVGILEIRKSEKKTSCNCISVVGGEYLAGRTLKPTHNSSVIVFFLTWIMGKRPWSHNAIGTHSGILAKHFYKEILKIIDTDEYCFAEIFPDVLGRTNKVIKEQSADEFTIQLYESGDFPTITCRGIDGTWTGAVDISSDGYLVVDDLVRDRQHSLSPRRMEDTFQEYLNKMVDRKNDGAKELMIGTLWSVIDPLMRIEAEHSGDDRYCFLKIPALDPATDESNFQYEVKGFSTQYYREMRDRLDSAEWMAKFQQDPFVREGLLYPHDELTFFNGVLPDGDSRVVAVVDVAWGGGDALSMPIGREYEDGKVYIFDWIFNRGPKETTIPLVVAGIMDNEIRQCQFEGNVGGAMYSSYVDERLSEYDYKCSCTEKKAPNKMSKMEKIVAYAGDVKRKFVFLDTNGHIDKSAKEDTADVVRYRRSAEYQAAMDELAMFVTVGKNEHDDAADSLTQLSMFIEQPNTRRKTHVIRGGLL